MANNKKAESEAEFRHHTSIGPNGEVLYDAPVEIRNQEDLSNYGISWNDTKTLSFHGSERVRVYFLKVESREVAEYLWSDMDSKHSREYAESRCWVPGRRKLWVRCPTTVPCAKCPHKDDRKPPFISLDALLESGYEPIAATAAEDQVLSREEYRDIRSMMDAEDVRIGRAFELKELVGLKADAIAAELGISAPRVYQLLARGREIAREYRDNNR